MSHHVTEPGPNYELMVIVWAFTHRGLSSLSCRLHPSLVHPQRRLAWGVTQPVEVCFVARGNARQTPAARGRCQRETGLELDILDLTRVAYTPRGDPVVSTKAPPMSLLGDSSRLSGLLHTSPAHCSTTLPPNVGSAILRDLEGDWSTTLHN